MEISKKSIYNNLHLLAIEQLAEEYKAKGYKVEKEKTLGPFKVDLLASNNEENIVFEVKTGFLNSERKKKLAELADYVNGQKKFKFKIIIARPPIERAIDIEGFEDLLEEYLSNNMPSDLDDLSTHTSIDNIYDIEFNHIIVFKDNHINIIGQGIIEVRIQYGSDGDQRRGDGHYQYESFPMNFDLTLIYNHESKIEIQKYPSIEIDTSSHY